MTTFNDDGSITVDGIAREDEADVFTFDIKMNPFKVEQRTNGILTQVISPINSMYIEDTVNPVFTTGSGSCFDGLKERAISHSGKDVYGG